MMRRFDFVDGMVVSACLIGAILGYAFAWWWLVATIIGIAGVYVIVFWRYWR